MNLLTYTPPENRVVPIPSVEYCWFNIDGKDALWRRFLIWLGLEIIEFGWRFQYRDDAREIGPLDHIRWFIEGIGSRIFDLGHHGSISGERMAINGEIPWEYVGRELRLRVMAKYPECFTEARQ
jgi:hypothetical protein